MGTGLKPLIERFGGNVLMPDSLRLVANAVRGHHCALAPVP
jgi:hypothetical protein